MILLLAYYTLVLHHSAYAFHLTSSHYIDILSSHTLRRRVNTVQDILRDQIHIICTTAYYYSILLLLSTVPY